MTDKYHAVELQPPFFEAKADRRLAKEAAETLAEIDWRSEGGRQRLRASRKAFYTRVQEASAVDEPLKLRVLLGVLCDLRAQGWSFEEFEGGVRAFTPASYEDQQDEKARVRAGLLFERNKQLRQPSVRSFVQDMEERRYTDSGWHSIFSLMREGRDLAGELSRISKLGEDSERHEALSQVVDPYIQIVDETRCEFTGLKLKDIWRYFRYTWVNPHKTVPGRNLWILIRDRAIEPHPIVGIAALSSAVMRLKVRDQRIGWDPDSFLAFLDLNASEEWAGWLLDSLRHLMSEVYTADFEREGIIESSNLMSPTRDVIDNLEEVAARARRRHDQHSSAKQHKGGTRGKDVDWVSRAESHLYRYKRASRLVELMKAVRQLSGIGFGEGEDGGLDAVLDSEDGRRSVKTILRLRKAETVGVKMMDISVCGAIPPYNPILGGKLVSLLMLSPEIRRAYQEKYERQPSIIASSMAGRAVHREPELVYLSTTSLYGVGSSQYNRLRLPGDRVGAESSCKIRFEELGKTSGYGSFHVSRDTLDDMEVVLARQSNGRTVNSIFGEGVSPRLRKIRAGLDAVGLPSDQLLQHGSRRLVYGIALAQNVKDVLVGKDGEPEYILPQTNPEQRTAMIARFWLERWLSMRIEKEFVRSRVAKHSLSRPIEHGARVQLPRSEEQEHLFWDVE